MEERKIYQLTSGEGYVVVVNENFVTLRYAGSSVYTSVRAFLADDNGQSQKFDDVAEAVTWATSAAESHVGKPRACRQSNLVQMTIALIWQTAR